MRLLEVLMLRICTVSYVNKHEGYIGAVGADILRTCFVCGYMIELLANPSR